MLALGGAEQRLSLALLLARGLQLADVEEGEEAAPLALQLDRAGREQHRALLARSVEEETLDLVHALAAQ